MSPPLTVRLVTAQLTHGGVTDHVKLLTQAMQQAGLSADAFAASDPLPTAPPEAWTIVHFVAYSWARQGVLRARNIATLEQLFGAGRRAIFFHELWIGAAQGATLKERLLGALQRRGIKQCLRRTRPERVFTSNPTYQAMLRRIGVDAEIIPLPGNLPLPTHENHQAAQNWLQKNAFDREQRPPLAVTFGILHPEWTGGAALQSWLQTHGSSARPPVLLALGRVGPAGAQILDTLQSELPDIRIVRGGQLPAHLIAGLLQHADFGIATSPWALMGKSGSAAAMFEAGLPVLVTRDDWRLRHGPTPAPAVSALARLWQPHGAFSWADFLQSRRAPQATLNTTVNRWHAALSR